MNDQIRKRLAGNWQRVQDEVAAAAGRCGRDPNSVTIIGVSKYIDVDLTRALFDLGCQHLGESRPQSMWNKATALDNADIHWHLIGHLQRNKVRRTLTINPLIHSVDSQRILDSLSEEAGRQNRTVSVLLEVNISGDDAKTGLRPIDLEALMQRLPIDNVQVRGLMVMAGWGTKPDDELIQFEQSRRLRDAVEQKFQHPLPELSMGMSGDFAQAIAAGATMVRIGSSLLEGIQ